MAQEILQVLALLLQFLLHFFLTLMNLSSGSSAHVLS
jgi:hypothetical protein